MNGSQQLSFLPSSANLFPEYLHLVLCISGHKGPTGPVKLCKIPGTVMAFMSNWEIISKPSISTGFYL